jgi:CBS domain containing-hemolysin-like protein
LRGLAKDEHAHLIGAYVKPIKTIPETVQSDHLLVQFQKMKLHIAVAVDEENRTTGLVTLEDVLEVLVGEIMDETDEHEDMRKIS